MKTVIKINGKDNVATCARMLQKGEEITVDGRKITVNEDIPKYHKVAVSRIARGELCYKYGEIIGRVNADINPGDYVHVHNLESTRGRGDIAEGKGK